MGKNTTTYDWESPAGLLPDLIHLKYLHTTGDGTKIQHSGKN